MVTWITSDPHFGHAKVAEYRGFTSAEDHDAHLLENYREAFREGDEVWWLGDIAFAGWQERLPLTVGSLPGRHHLVLGNHDRPHPMMSRVQDYQRDWLDAAFASVSTMARISFGGKGALLSHFPYVGDTAKRGEDRYSEWRLRDEGGALIHGHTHGPERLTITNEGTRQLHVGVDAWGLRPVRMSTAFACLTSAGAWG